MGGKINCSLMYYSALRAAYGGCALYAPAGAVARERPKAPLCKGSCQKSLIFD